MSARKEEEEEEEERLVDLVAQRSDKNKAELLPSCGAAFGELLDATQDRSRAKLNPKSAAAAAQNWSSLFETARKVLDPEDCGNLYLAQLLLSSLHIFVPTVQPQHANVDYFGRRWFIVSAFGACMRVPNRYTYYGIRPSKVHTHFARSVRSFTCIFNFELERWK